MVTHDIDTLRAISDRIAVLVNKKLVIGTIDDLRNNKDPWIQDYFSGVREPGRCCAEMETGDPLMETKANYVAVGAFVLACVIGFVVTVLWLAGRQYSQEYAYYQSYFKGGVTGLGKGTATRYNGIEVGRITDLEFDPKDPQRVIVTMQVQPNLNIREDSVASIESQGFAGAPFVEITGGTATTPVLVAHNDERYPVIKTKPSTFALLQQSAPQVVDKLNIAASRINDLLNDDNRHAIAHILANLDETTQAVVRAAQRRHRCRHLQRQGQNDGQFQQGVRRGSNPRWTASTSPSKNTASWRTIPMPSS